MRISRWAFTALIPIVALALLVGAAPLEAEAAGPTTLGATAWQGIRPYAPVHTAAFPNHGNTGFYSYIPGPVPGLADPGWTNCGPGNPLCPSALTIGLNNPNGSRLGGQFACLASADFTFYQSSVSIPAGTTISQFSVNMSGADDGARVAIYNSANPGGFVFAGSYIFLGGSQSTTDMSSAMIAGEVNRVVITQMDDCATGNNLQSAQIFLNGTVIPPVPTADLAITKVALQPTASVGSTITYQINVQNYGPAAASAIVIEDILPANVKFMSTVPGCVHDGALTGGKVTCSGIPVLAGNSTPPIVITVQAMQVGPAQNNVSITNLGANLIDPNLANNAASVMTNITPPPVPPAPPFTLTGPVLASAKVCVPLYMDQNLQTQYWWVRAMGGALQVNFAAVGINAAEAGSATVKVFNPGGTQIASHTVAYAGTLTVPAPSVVAAAAPGDLYRVEVLVTAPPSGPVARHYLLSANGASLIGTNSPLQPQGEHENARWRVNVDGTGLSIQLSPAPEAPLTTGSMVIIDPTGVVAATVPLSPAGGSYSAPGAAPGQWKVAIRGADGHYLLNKTTGADRGLYLGWDAAGEGAILGTVTRGGVPNTVPVDVQVGGMTLPGILDSFTLAKSPVGTYPVNLVGTGVSGSVTVTCDGTTSIALDIPLIPTNTTVSFGAGPFVYTGNPFSATANVTPGAAGSAVVTYAGDCINAGSTCTATATFAATAVYAASSATASITIDKAPSVTVVNGGGTFVYDGSGHPLTAVVTGAGGLNQPVAPVVGCLPAPTNVADSCTGTATYAGDANHLGSTGSATVTIEKAPSLTVVNGGGTFVYDATAHPLTAVVTGAGGLNQPVTPVVGCGAAPTNVADSCTGTATYPGDANHLSSTGSATVTITKAPSTTVVNGGGTFTYDGTGHPLSAVVTGVGGLNQPLPVVGCVASPTLPADNCTGTATFAGDANHLGSTGSATVTIKINYANPAGGVFVIGNQTPHGLLSTVNFWGAQWAKNNTLSGGSAPSAFKGFENTVAAPACGSTWTTAPGNSAGPPSSIPEYMVVVVSSNITKSGSTISGNVAKVIVVKTNPGYSSNPGHEGTGTVLQVLCTAP